MYYPNRNIFPGGSNFYKKRSNSPSRTVKGLLQSRGWDPREKEKQCESTDSAQGPMRWERGIHSRPEWGLPPPADQRPGVGESFSRVHAHVGRAGCKPMWSRWCFLSREVPGIFTFCLILFPCSTKEEKALDQPCQGFQFPVLSLH